MLKSLPTSNKCSVLWVSEVTAHFWGFVPHYWQKQLYMGQGAVAILDFCELQISASTFSTTGHVPCWLQWQDNECHHPPQKAFTHLCSWCWTPVLHQGNPSDAISCSLVWWQCKKRTYPKPGLSPALLLFWLALCSLKLFHSIRAPCHKPQRAQIVFGLVLCLSSTSRPWLAPGAATRRSSPCQPPRVVQIHLQGTPAWSGSTHIPWPQGSTLAAERGERGGRQDKGNWEKRSQDTNPTTHRSYTSHSPTPFGQTNLKTRSLTRLSLRTSLDHWQVSPIYSVIFILCKQGCVEFFFLFFFPKISADPYLTHPAYNYISILSFQKNLTDAHTWQYSGSSWPYWKQRAKETKIQQKSSWPQTRVHTEHKNKLSSAQ